MIGILGPAAAVLAGMTAPLLLGEPETPREAAARITALLSADKWAAAEKATESLVRTANEHHAAAVFGLLLRDQTVPGRSHLMPPIARARFRPAVPHLIDLLDDPEAGIRTWAATTLGEIGDKSAVPFLDRRLRAADEDQRYTIRVALARLGRPYLGYFIEGLRDRAPGRRCGCAAALRDLKDPRAVPHLLARLDEPNDDSTLSVRWALRDTTGVPETVVVGTTVHPDGSTSDELRVRPVAELRNDIEAWVGRNREAVRRAVEPPAERWVFTAEPELPVLGVSFRMTAADVKRVLDKAGVKYTHHPERLERQPGGNATYYPERIDADDQVAFDGVWGLYYEFAHGRLEGVGFMAGRRDRDLAGLEKPLRLKPDAVYGWTGLEGAIRIDETFGDAEKTACMIRLNYKNR